MEDASQRLTSRTASPALSGPAPELRKGRSGLQARGSRLVLAYLTLRSSSSYWFRVSYSSPPPRISNEPIFLNQPFPLFNFCIVRGDISDKENLNPERNSDFE